MQNNTKLKLKILYKISNSFQGKMVKMQYTSVNQKGQIKLFKEKEEFNV